MLPNIFQCLVNFLASKSGTDSALLAFGWRYCHFESGKASALPAFDWRYRDFDVFKIVLALARHRYEFIMDE
jgi:hypothetical protein